MDAYVVTGGGPGNRPGDAIAVLSDAASFLTGATLPMDGGRTILRREPQP